MFLVENEDSKSRMVITSNRDIKETLGWKLSPVVFYHWLTLRNATGLSGQPDTLHLTLVGKVWIPPTHWTLLSYHCNGKNMFIFFVSKHCKEFRSAWKFSKIFYMMKKNGKERRSKGNTSREVFVYMMITKRNNFIEDLK